MNQPALEKIMEFFISRQWMAEGGVGFDYGVLPSTEIESGLRAAFLKARKWYETTDEVGTFCYICGQTFSDIKKVLKGIKDEEKAKEILGRGRAVVLSAKYAYKSDVLEYFAAYILPVIIGFSRKENVEDNLKRLIEQLMRFDREERNLISLKNAKTEDRSWPGFLRYSVTRIAQTSSSFDDLRSRVGEAWKKVSLFLSEGDFETAKWFVKDGYEVYENLPHIRSEILNAKKKAEDRGDKEMADAYGLILSNENSLERASIGIYRAQQESGGLKAPEVMLKYLPSKVRGIQNIGVRLGNLRYGGVLEIQSNPAEDSFYSVGEKNLRRYIDEGIDQGAKYIIIGENHNDPFITQVVLCAIKTARLRGSKVNLYIEALLRGDYEEKGVMLYGGVYRSNPKKYDALISEALAAGVKVHGLDDEHSDNLSRERVDLGAQYLISNKEELNIILVGQGHSNYWQESQRTGDDGLVMQAQMMRHGAKPEDMLTIAYRGIDGKYVSQEFAGFEVHRIEDLEPEDLVSEIDPKSACQTFRDKRIADLVVVIHNYKTSPQKGDIQAAQADDSSDDLWDAVSKTKFINLSPEDQEAQMKEFLKKIGAKEENPAVQSKALSYDEMIAKVNDKRVDEFVTRVWGEGLENEEKSVGKLMTPEEAIEAINENEEEIQKFSAKIWGDESLDHALEDLKDSGFINMPYDKQVAYQNKLRESLGEKWNELPGILTISLKEGDPGLRTNAAELLGAIGGRDAVPQLMNALSDEEPLVRLHAAKSLGRLGDRRAVKILRTALRNEDHPGVRIQAQSAMNSIEEMAPQTARSFLEGARRKISPDSEGLRDRKREEWEAWVRDAEELYPLYSVFNPIKIHAKGLSKDILGMVKEAEEKIRSDIRNDSVDNIPYTDYSEGQRREGLIAYGTHADADLGELSWLADLKDSPENVVKLKKFFLESIASPQVSKEEIDIRIEDCCFPYAGFMNSAIKRGIINIGDYPLPDELANEIEYEMRKKNSLWVMTEARRKNIAAMRKVYFVLHELYELDGLILTDLLGGAQDRHQEYKRGLFAMYQSHLLTSKENRGFNEYPPIINALTLIAEALGDNSKEKVEVNSLFGFIHVQDGVPEVSVKYDSQLRNGLELDEKIAAIARGENAKSVTSSMVEEKVYIGEEAFNRPKISQVREIRMRFEQLVREHKESGLRSSRLLFNPSDVFYLLRVVAALQDHSDQRYIEAREALIRILNVVDDGDLGENSLVQAVLELFESRYPGIGSRIHY